MRIFPALLHPLHCCCFALCFIALPAVHAANNILSTHPSSYLRAHQDDAVQWRLFNQTAFQQAQATQKPILLSSGYQACYWCYRMKQDSFNNPALGALINANFIPVIVDRELEVETDQWLQRFMEQQRGFGGWPLTVILTPDGKPVAGFSYTPAAPFSDTLQRFLQDWQNNSQPIKERANQHYQALQSAQQQTDNQDNNSAQQQTVAEQTTAGVLLKSLLQQLSSAADNSYGGFGEREKFPHTPQLNALFELQTLNPDPTLRDFLQTTLAAMIGGSLRDHLGGGFFRYSDNQDWGQPHYEKMLYTQALLAPLLIRAGTTWRQPIYVRTGTATLRSMIKDFQRDDSYFRSSLSAVSTAGQSGGYYLWTEGQLTQTLDTKQLAKVLNMLGDEATLVLPFLLAQGAEKEGMQEALLAARGQRQLSVDDKALTGWNGLALSALAAGSVLDANINQAGEKLAAKLLRLSRQDVITQLADQTATAKSSDQDEKTKRTQSHSIKTASLSAQVYLAQGLADWGRQQQETLYLNAAAQLLLRIKQRYHRPNGWVYSENNPLLGTLMRPQLPDSQLPSASALWQQTTRMLLDAGLPDYKEQLATAIAEVETQTDAGVTEQAFYHASYIAQRVKQQIMQVTETPQGAQTQ